MIVLPPYAAPMLFVASIIPLHRLSQLRGKSVQLIKTVNRMTRHLLLRIKNPEVLLRRIEKQPANGTPVVVIQQNAAIALRVPNEHALRVDDFSDDRFDEAITSAFLVASSVSRLPSIFGAREASSLRRSIKSIAQSPLGISGWRDSKGRRAYAKQ